MIYSLGVQPLPRPYARHNWPDVRVACVWLPELPLRVEVLRSPRLEGRPLVVGGGPGQRHVVTLCSAAAARAGVRPGLPLREVLPLCPDAVVVPPDPIRTAGVLEAAAAALERVSPIVEVGAEELYLDLRGLRELYRADLTNLERAIRAAVPSLLLPRLGVAAGKLVAAVAAREAPRQGARIVPAGEARGFLAPLPIDHLPLGVDALGWLRRLGLHTIGELAALPVGAVQAQLGPAGARAWHFAWGRDDEPVVPRRPTPSVRAAMRLDDPLASTDALFLALRMVLERAFADPLARNRAARQARLGALLADGSAWEQVITFKEPMAGADAAWTALKHRLGAAGMLPAAPVEELAVELRGLDGVPGRQENLFVNHQRPANAIQEVVARLEARDSHPPLYRAVPVEPWSRIPEERWALVPLERKHQDIS